MEKPRSTTYEYPAMADGNIMTVTKDLLAIVTDILSGNASIKLEVDKAIIWKIRGSKDNTLVAVRYKTSPTTPSYETNLDKLSEHESSIPVPPIKYGSNSHDNRIVASNFLGSSYELLNSHVETEVEIPCADEAFGHSNTCEIVQTKEPTDTTVSKRSVKVGTDQVNHTNDCFRSLPKACRNRAEATNSKADATFDVPIKVEPPDTGYENSSEIISNDVDTVHSLLEHKTCSIKLEPVDGPRIVNPRIKETHKISQTTRTNANHSRDQREIIICSLCHKRVFTKSGKHVCSKKAREQQRRQKLNIGHKESHSKECFICHYCQKIFASKAKLKRHVSVHTRGKSNANVMCKKSAVHRHDPHTLANQGIVSVPVVAEDNKSMHYSDQQYCAETSDMHTHFGT